MRSKCVEHICTLDYTKYPNRIGQEFTSDYNIKLKKGDKVIIGTSIDNDCVGYIIHYDNKSIPLRNSEEYANHFISIKNWRNLKIDEIINGNL